MVFLSFPAIIAVLDFLYKSIILFYTIIWLNSKPGYQKQGTNGTLKNVHEVCKCDAVD